MHVVACIVDLKSSGASGAFFWGANATLKRSMVHTRMSVDASSLNEACAAIKHGSAANACAAPWQ
jgi:hypothetical protein